MHVAWSNGPGSTSQVAEKTQATDRKGVEEPQAARLTLARLARQRAMSAGQSYFSGTLHVAWHPRELCRAS